MYVYSVQVYHSVYLQCTGILHCIFTMYRYFTRSDWIMCFIKCTLLCYSSFFGNVIVDISCYRLCVGNYGQLTLSDRCFPLLSIKTRYVRIYYCLCTKMCCNNNRFFFLQLEKSPTFGSIETSDSEKRQLAQQSLSFNLKNKIFIELFPETTEVSSFPPYWLDSLFA